jgi:hypothetical protein
MALPFDGMVRLILQTFADCQALFSTALFSTD